MLTTDKAIQIYTWKSNKLNQGDPKVIIKDMNSDRDNYSPEDNVKQIARLFSMSLPGNTVDIIYDEIAQGLMHLINPDYDFALDKQYISNIVRIVINELSDKD